MARVGEAVIRGIIRSIVSTCHDENHHISQSLAGALVRLGSQPLREAMSKQLLRS